MKVLVIGLGSIGRRHAANALALGSEVALVRHGKSHDKKQSAFLKKHALQCFYDLSEALREWKPNAVIVANPTALHLETARAVLRYSNAHLFIEKPISHEIHGVSPFLKMAEKAGRIVAVGYHFRHHPQLKKIKALLEKGALSDIFFARFTTGEYLPNWHPWEDYRSGYAARAELGGGAALTQSHDVDAALWFFGPAQRARGNFRTSGLLELNVDDNTDIHATLERCPSASFHIDYLTRPPLKRYEIFGTKGRLEWNYRHDGSTLELLRANGTTRSYPLPKNFDRNDMYLAALKEFFACIKNKNQPLSNGWSALAVLQLIERCSKNKNR